MGINQRGHVTPKKNYVWACNTKEMINGADVIVGM